MPKGPNSPLNTWLKVQLREAWQRELEFKRILREVFDKSQETLSAKTNDLKSQLSAVFCDLERWQMRNEEMDTRLQTWQSRCWSLKQINLEEQRLIKALHLERAEYLEYQKRCRKISENSISFTRFECQKLGQAIQHD